MKPSSEEGFILFLFSEGVRCLHIALLKLLETDERCDMKTIKDRSA
jgi:hypothetical protein